MPSSRTSLLTLEQFIAFNDELAALIRAGVPLDAGLSDLAVDMRHGLGQVSLRVAEEVQKGQSLDAAIESHQSHFPPRYAALIRAGLAAGRLDELLAAMSHSARRAVAIRRTVTVASIYPLIVILCAWGLLLACVARPVNELRSIYEGPYFIAPSPWLHWVLLIPEQVRPFWWTVPLLVVCLLAYGFWNGRARQWKIPFWVVHMPILGRMARASELAGILDLLGVLLEQQVPLPEAARLSAAMTSSSRYRSALLNIAQQVEAGREPAPEDLAPFPVLVRWSLTAPGTALRATVIRRSAQQLEGKATDSIRLLAEWLPRLAAAVIAGLVVLIYGLILFLPLTSFLMDLFQ